MNKVSKIKFAEWSKYAGEDQVMAELAIEEDGPPNQICFHSQQMAEKYLKGYLASFRIRFEKSHQVIYLLELCEKLDKTFAELKNDAIFLTQFYIETRYPGDIPQFTLSECRKALDSALKIKKFVLKKIQSNREN